MHWHTEIMLLEIFKITFLEMEFNLCFYPMRRIYCVYALVVTPGGDYLGHTKFSLKEKPC